MKFKIGDVVKVKEGERIGETGIVVEIDRISNLILVKFDDGKKIWYHESWIEVVKEFSVLESKVGDE